MATVTIDLDNGERIVIHGATVSIRRDVGAAYLGRDWWTVEASGDKVERRRDDDGPDRG